MASSNASCSLLPFDLVENILYKVPVESLVRFKSTCKQWYALLNDRRFIYKHLELSREGLLQVLDQMLYQFINVETLALSSLQGPSDISSMIHCDGLLLCECRSDSTDQKLAVWNPFLSQVKWIEALSSIKVHCEIYGFGYDNVSRDNYKILRFYRGLGYDYESRNNGIEIYEFKTQLWRSVDYSCAYLWYAWYEQGVSMNGNMYWVAGRLHTDTTEFFIQCFDFSREIFEDTCCLPFITRGDDYLVASRLSGFGGDRLSLLSRDKDRKIKLWVTNNLSDEIVSWSKYFNVTTPYLPVLYRYISYTTFFIHKTYRIMLWCEEEDVKKKEKYTNVYEIGEGVVEKQVETGRHRWCYQTFRSRCCVFVPSLVPVPE